MKKTIRITAIVLALVLCVLTLASCSSFRSIKRSFEKNGYELTSSDNEKTGEIKTEDGTLTYTIHVFQREGTGLLGNLTEALSTAIVWEFDSDKDLEKALESSEEIKAVLEDAAESDFVNGNCVLMTINPDAVKIFNGETLD